MAKLLGSKSTTHVANCSDHDPIYAHVSMDQIVVKSITFGRKSDGTLMGKAEFETQASREGFLKINPRQYAPFVPAGSGRRVFGTDTVYVSIVKYEICKNWPIEENDSVICTKKGDMKLAEMGKIFKDRDGIEQ